MQILLLLLLFELTIELYIYSHNFVFFVTISQSGENQNTNYCQKHFDNFFTDLFKVLQKTTLIYSLKGTRLKMHAITRELRANEK